MCNPEVKLITRSDLHCFAWVKTSQKCPFVLAITAGPLSDCVINIAAIYGKADYEHGANIITFFNPRIVLTCSVCGWL